LKSEGRAVWSAPPLRAERSYLRLLPIRSP